MRIFDCKRFILPYIAVAHTFLLTASPVREHLLSSCGYLRSSAMPSKDATLPPGEEHSARIRRRGRPGWFRAARNSLVSRTSINCILYARPVNCYGLYPAGETLCKQFFARRKNRCRTFPLTQYPTENSPICRLFEVKSILIGEHIDFDDQRHELRIERPEAGGAVLPGWSDLPRPLAPYFGNMIFDFALI